MIGLLVSLVLVGVLGYMAYSGARRGTILISLELVTFILATAVALATYPLLGGLLRSFTAVTTALGNVAAFTLIWMVVEIGSALLVRIFVFPHFPEHLQLTVINRAGGALLNVVKGTVIIFLGLVLFAGLPLSASAKRPVTDSPVAHAITGSSGQLQGWLAQNLGRDLGDSLNFFTVTATPNSGERVELGYTTTTVVPDPTEESAMLTMINAERTKRGLGALTLRPAARDVARAYSREMFAHGYFSHINSAGKNPFDRLQAAGVSFDTAGENLALAPTLQLAHQGLMNSPGHRANLLSPNYKQIGIGIMDGGPYGLMITQEFTD